MPGGKGADRQRGADPSDGSDRPSQRDLKGENEPAIQRAEARGTQGRGCLCNGLSEALNPFLSLSFPICGGEPTYSQSFGGIEGEDVSSQTQRPLDSVPACVYGNRAVLPVLPRDTPHLQTP